MQPNSTINSKRTFLKSALGLAVLPSVASKAASPAADPAITAAAPKKGGPRANYFPNVLLQTHDGRTLRFYDDVVRGKTVIFNMMYAMCSNVCPPNTANLVKVQEHLGGRVGKDIFMYSLTLRPEFDDAAALRDYVKQYDIAPGWTFLTGKPADMDLIRRRLGFYDIDPAIDAELSQHTGMIRFGDERRDRWAMMPAQSAASQIARSILTM
jgi:protein SCO1/2